MAKTHFLRWDGTYTPVPLPSGKNKRLSHEPRFNWNFTVSLFLGRTRSLKDSAGDLMATLDGMLVHCRTPQNSVRLPPLIAVTYLYIWVKRGPVRVNCLTPTIQHNENRQGASHTWPSVLYNMLLIQVQRRKERHLRKLCSTEHFLFNFRQIFSFRLKAVKKAYIDNRK